MRFLSRLFVALTLVMLYACGGGGGGGSAPAPAPAPTPTIEDYIATVVVDIPGTAAVTGTATATRTASSTSTATRTASATATRTANSTATQTVGTSTATEFVQVVEQYDVVNEEEVEVSQVGEEEYTTTVTQVPAVAASTGTATVAATREVN